VNQSVEPPIRNLIQALTGTLVRALILCACCPSVLLAQAGAPAAAPKAPIHVKVVVVTMFERGEDTGDAPGEYQLWVEREHLDEIIPLPAAPDCCDDLVPRHFEWPGSASSQNRRAMDVHLPR